MRTQKEKRMLILLSQVSRLNWHCSHPLQMEIKTLLEEELGEDYKIIPDKDLFYRIKG